MFHAENESEKDLYRITIEGTGNDLSMHRFTFEPSLTWLCRRYPDNSRRPALTASTGGALGSDSASNSGSDVPPQQVAVVSGKPAAGTCDDGGGGDGGGGPRLSASEALVRDLQSKLEFLSDSGDLYRCVVRRSQPPDPTRRTRNPQASRSKEPLLGSRHGHKYEMAEVPPLSGGGGLDGAPRRLSQPPPSPPPPPSLAARPQFPCCDGSTRLIGVLLIPSLEAQRRRHWPSPACPARLLLSSASASR